MAPVGERIYVQAYLPLSENRIAFTEAVERGAAPLRTFMLKRVRKATWRYSPRSPTNPSRRTWTRFRCAC